MARGQWLRRFKGGAIISIRSLLYNEKVTNVNINPLIP